MTDKSQKLSFLEKAGYSGGDAAANFVFMSMILFQANFYTDVFGLTAGVAGTIILVARLWDAFFDPIMGFLADRTQTRWGPISSVGIMDFDSVGGGHGFGLHDAQLRPTGNDCICLRDQHSIDDALFRQQHALFGVGCGNDQRCG